MKSPITGKEMKLIREKKELSFRKEKFYYINQSYWCEDSKMSFVDETLEATNMNQIYNQYREKHGIPFQEEIVEVRKKYGLPANKMSSVFGFGANQWRLYEEGEIPNSSNALLIYSAKNPNNFKSLLINRKDKFSEKEFEKFLKNVDNVIEESERNSMQEYIEQYILGNKKATKYNGYKIPNWVKISQVVAYFSEKMQPLKTTLNKLLYYADALHYRETGYSITGISYKAIQYGNVPDNFDLIFNKLERDNIIDREYLQFKNGNEGEKFRSNKYQEEKLTVQEREVLNYVYQVFKNKKPQEIVNICHEEDSWLENEGEKNIIDYKYSFQIKAL